MKYSEDSDGSGEGEGDDKPSIRGNDPCEWECVTMHVQTLGHLETEVNVRDGASTAVVPSLSTFGSSGGGSGGGIGGGSGSLSRLGSMQHMKQQQESQQESQQELQQEMQQESQSSSNMDKYAGQGRDIM